ncbi:MAG: RNA 2'-phosphotransferase [Selenomonadaceae bacterium]|nr:RNA 2'-phosphotransferase [Selenomonadaceae bacterium]
MKDTSKFLSLILRHKPQIVGIKLDEHGWAEVDELIRRVKGLDLATLEKIVASDEKQRYSFSADGKLIRANQGHSIPVDVELAELEPPEFLYHGTAERFGSSIVAQSLLKMSRLYCI